MQLQLEDSPVEEQLKTDRPVGGLLQLQLELIKKIQNHRKTHTQPDRKNGTDQFRYIDDACTFCGNFARVSSHGRYRPRLFAVVQTYVS